MTEEEFRSNVPPQSVDEQIATEAEAPLANVDAGVSAPTASTEETPAVTSVSESAASPNAEDTSAVVPTGPVEVENVPVVGEASPQVDADVGASVAETTVPHEGFIERVVDEVECVLEAGVKEAETLVQEAEEAFSSEVSNG